MDSVEAVPLEFDEDIQNTLQEPNENSEEEINEEVLWVIVGEDGSRLGATLSVSYEKHLAAYKSGKKN